MSADSVIESLRQAVLQASQQRQALRIRGGGSKDFYGEPASGAVLDVSALRGIVSYEPSELVITAYCGTPLAEVEAALAQAGQMLAFEPPAFSVKATVGGVVAAGLSGPRRAWAGGVRDFVLGASMLDGAGRHLHFGGQVMKNVAGYDVSRLMTGALGVLGLMTQVSLKVLPVPPASATLRFECDQAAAIQQVNTWSGRPLPLTATAWANGVLHVRLSGARAAVDSAISQLGGERLSDTSATDLWMGLRDQSAAFFKAGTMGSALWRLSLPPTARVITGQDLPGADNQLVEWGGAQRWLWSAADAATVRQVARNLGGHAVCFDNRLASVNAFEEPVPALMAIHQRLKQQFDPRGIFNPGRLYRDL